MSRTHPALVQATNLLGGFEGRSMEVIGLDHIYLAVSDMNRAERFYDQVMQVLGFRKGDKSIGDGE